MYVRVREKVTAVLHCVQFDLNNERGSGGGG